MTAEVPDPPNTAGTDELRSGSWSEAELARLREWYGLRPDTQIARELKRPLQSVRDTARRLFPGGDRRDPWSPEEVLRLKQYLGASPENLIARIFGRPTEEIQRQIEALDAQRCERELTAEELRRLKRLYGSRRDEDLARIFGCRIETILESAARYRLAKDKAFLRRIHGRKATRMPRWSEAELKLLREIYPVTSNLEIARRLERSVKSIVSKAHHLRLKKNAERLREMGRQNVSRRYTGD